MNTLKTLSFILSLSILANQAAAASKNKPNHTYYKPATVFSSSTKDKKSVGIYQRAQIGNDGAYGTFTQKGKTLSQTVLEHNPTATPIPGVTDATMIGFIQNTNPGAGSLGAPTYIALYPYKAPITLQKKAPSNKHSMPMKTAQYSQKK